MAHYQIVCGSCGYRIHSSLLAESLATNKALIQAITLVLASTHGHTATLQQALEKVPNEVKEAIFPRLEPL